MTQSMQLSPVTIEAACHGDPMSARNEWRLPLSGPQIAELEYSAVALSRTIRTYNCSRRKISYWLNARLPSSPGMSMSTIDAASNKSLSHAGAFSAKVRDLLSFHFDSFDVDALMCLRPAPEGGILSRSAAHIYNEIRKCRPDLAPLLLEPFF